MPPERRHSEWLSGGRPPKRPVLVSVGLTGLCGSALAVMSLAAFSKGLDLSPFFLTIFGAMALSYLVMVAGIFWEFRRRAQRVPLGEGPSGVPQFPAIALLRREVGYGAEEGLLSFVDGWLVFSGGSLSFSVRRSDVELDPKQDRLAFAFAGPHGTHRTILQPMGSPKNLREAWAEWARMGAEPAGAPLYPPVLPSPVRREHSMWRFYALFIALMGLLSLRALPLVGAAELLFALTVLYLDLSGRAALHRIANGEPPRRKGLRGAYWSLRQGEPFQTVAQRALGRAERALR